MAENKPHYARVNKLHARIFVSFRSSWEEEENKNKNKNKGYVHTGICLALPGTSTLNHRRSTSPSQIQHEPQQRIDTPNNSQSLAGQPTEKEEPRSQSQIRREPSGPVPFRARSRRRKIKNKKMTNCGPGSKLRNPTCTSPTDIMERDKTNPWNDSALG